MMKIRFGEYTIYNGIEMAITEYYGHGLDQETAEKHRVVSYPKEQGKKLGFQLDSDSTVYKKDILISELSNSFFVITKAIYKGKEVFIWAYNPEKNNFTVYTYDNLTGEELGFIKLSDRYIQEIKKDEIIKIWEERTHCKYNTLFPEGLEFIKEIDISQDSL